MIYFNKNIKHTFNKNIKQVSCILADNIVQLIDTFDRVAHLVESG